MIFSDGHNFFMSDNTALGEINRKWGAITQGYYGGWTGVPNMLLKEQGNLGLKSLELNVLINLLRFWWVTTNMPFPSPEKMAQEIGVSERTIYRTIATLEKNGFITRIQEEDKPTKYDLTKLVEKLNGIKKEMMKTND